MRKVLAWLGVATLAVVSSTRVQAANDVLKPYVVLILDTSGSMDAATGSGPTSCGGSDTRLDHAVCAINNIANSYGDMVLAFGRFRETTAGTYSTSCDANNDINGNVNASFPTPSGGDQCNTQGVYCGDCTAATGQGVACAGPGDCFSGICTGGHCQGAGSCTTADREFELLTPLVDGNNVDTAKYTDGICTTCGLSLAQNPEIWGVSPFTFTPLAAVLNGAKRYWLGLQATDGTVIWPSNQPGFAPIANDPKSSVFLPSTTPACNPSPTCTTNCCATQCRPYVVILLTDGDETCTTAANSQAAATSLLATNVTTGTPASLKKYRVVTKPIGFGKPPGDAQIEALAHAGGAPDVPGVNEGFYASDEASLELAISQILAGSVRSESCNNLDDDCDVAVDEDFPNKGGACTNGQLGVCARNGTLVCRADGTGLQCTAPTVTPGTESCNNMDDDCDGLVDEGLSNCNCVPQGELCNNMDDDCDGLVDEGITKQCGTGACLGTQTCANGMYGACSAQTPTTETCNGLDDDCDGIKDGFTVNCSNIVTPGGPPTDNPGDSSHNPIPQNICHPGTKTCPISPPGTGTFGTCTGEVKPCNGITPCIDGCNGIDDDCDNLIDEDFAPANCSTNCGVGQTSCVNGVITCNAQPAMTDNTCNNVDDDCDNMIDEDWVPPNPDVCGTGIVCNGKNHCVNGQVVCQGDPIGQESCNCNDDDCDGQTDEGNLCGPGATCTNCQCAFQCSPGEFPCPLGKKCNAQNFCVNDPCYGQNCPDVNGNKQTCIENPPNTAQCVDLCSTVSCPAGYVCIGSSGECKPDDCTTFPNRCMANESCVVGSTGFGTCISNPCSGVSCTSGQYCVGGVCVDSCADKDCPAGQRCRLGVCEPDPCGHACPYGQACNDSTGTCFEDPCKNVTCPPTQWCNPNHNGMCEADPCIGTMCPSSDQVCKGGTCYNPIDFLPDAGAEQHVTVGGGGCNTGGSGGDASFVLVLGAVGIALGKRRRARSGGRS
jgi:hypothetical protein